MWKTSCWPNRHLSCLVLHFIILEGSFHSFYGDSGWIAYFILILHMIFFVIFWISHFDDIYFFLSLIPFSRSFLPRYQIGVEVNPLGQQRITLSLYQMLIWNLCKEMYVPWTISFPFQQSILFSHYQCLQFYFFLMNLSLELTVC